MLTVSGAFVKIPGRARKAFWKSRSETMVPAPSAVHKAHAQIIFTAAYESDLEDCVP